MKGEQVPPPGLALPLTSKLAQPFLSRPTHPHPTLLLSSFLSHPAGDFL